MREISDASGDSAVVQMVATAEHFSTARSRSRLLEALPATTEMLAAALAAVERQIDTTWPNRRQAWRRWYGIETGKSYPFDKFMGFVEARNALLHGGGRLTLQQLKGDGGAYVRRQFAQVGITLRADRLYIGERNVRQCAAVTRDIVLWLDRELGAASEKPTQLQVGDGS
jgi:hypothetical protein